MNNSQSASKVLARLDQVSKRFGSVQALISLNLALHAGEILAILGPNGAGKTTAVSLWLNLQQADSGTVSLFDQDPKQLSAKYRIGAMLQSADLPDTLRVSELISMTQSYYPQPRDIKQLSAMAGIEEILHRPYGKLSGGQQRRVQFALAICAKVDILFLDEPTVGLDTQAREAMWQSLRALVSDGCAVVLTTHYLEEAEALADRVVVIAAGAIVAEGSVDSIRARVAMRKIRCITNLNIEHIKQWPAVDSVSLEGKIMTIQTLECETVTRHLLNQDSTLEQLEIKRAGLAEAFIEITREQI